MLKDRNKAIQFTRSEGGTIVPVTFDVYEDQLSGFTDVEKKEVFSKMFKRKLNTRVVKIGNVYVHALFFEDGRVYDVYPEGFKLRVLNGEELHD